MDIFKQDVGTMRICATEETSPSLGDRNALVQAFLLAAPKGYQPNIYSLLEGSLGLEHLKHVVNLIIVLY